MKDRMIMSRTPLRITFVGGGSDLPSFYSKYGPGAVVSATIAKYIYVIVNRKFDDKIRVSYSRTEIVNKVEEIQHPTVREALRLLEIDGGIEIVSISDIPSSGTGLGSSSTFLVGLLNALHAFKGEYTSAKQLSEEAVLIEREILQEPGGKQDQYAAAYGGINLMEFYPDETVSVKPLITKEEHREVLEKNLLLLYTGVGRKSTAIHKEQGTTIDDKVAAYKKMSGLARIFYDELCGGNIKTLGDLLHENWNLKKSLSNGISNGDIDEKYDRAIRSGALGGKIVGAGGGGFLLLLTPEDKRAAVLSATRPFKEEKVAFEYGGSRIMYVGE